MIRFGLPAANRGCLGTPAARSSKGKNLDALNLQDQTKGEVSLVNLWVSWPELSVSVYCSQFFPVLVEDHTIQIVRIPSQKD